MRGAATSASTPALPLVATVNGSVRADRRKAWEAAQQAAKEAREAIEAAGALVSGDVEPGLIEAWTAVLEKAEPSQALLDWVLENGHIPEVWELSPMAGRTLLELASLLTKTEEEGSGFCRGMLLGQQLAGAGAYFDTLGLQDDGDG